MADGKGMNSKKLSERARQPGHDRSFVVSESNFVNVAQLVLPAARYRVVDHPDDLRSIFVDDAGALGVVPEASIENLDTGRKFFVEVKKQGPAGNADERAFKHHTVQFYKLLKEIFGYDYHPFVTVLCENLAVDRKYVLKARYLYEPDNYLLWRDYDRDVLATYLNARCAAWLDG
ncbi:MAG: Type restriction enzyme MunI [Actinomycetota bacterium]